jgi:hypothetical protein
MPGVLKGRDLILAFDGIRCAERELGGTADGFADFGNFLFIL